MALGKQAKVLTKAQIDTLLIHVGNGRNPVRNRLIVLLSVKAGLRAKEIAHLTWSMVLNSDGTLSKEINLQDCASKGKSGRVIPMAKELFVELGKWQSSCKNAVLTNRQITQACLHDAASFRRSVCACRAHH